VAIEPGVGLPAAPRGHAQDALLRRAGAVFPGATTNSLHLAPDVAFVAERGEGAELVDVEGRRILDMALGGGALVLGHAHPAIRAAVTEALADGGHHYVLQRRTIELAERIVDLVPSAEMVRFTASGSEATLHALRLARAVTGRDGILKFDGAYHGHHDLAAWSFEWTPSSPPEPTAESAGIQAGVEHDLVVLPFNDPQAIRDRLAAEPDRFAAVIIEPIQRAIPASVEFLSAAREACDQTGTVLIYDEIVTGFRAAPGGYQQVAGVWPDLTALGKALGGGVPIAALVGRRRLMEYLSPDMPPGARSFHCGTFNGYQLGAEAAHVTLDILVDGGGIERLDALSRQAGDAMRRAFRDAGLPVQVLDGHGLFQPYLTDRPVVNAADVRASDRRRLFRFHELLLEAGVFKLPAKGYVSLAHGTGEIERLEEASRWALGRLDS
jgi:glutamate-1-semialdehyde 2,1-aminomutase